VPDEPICLPCKLNIFANLQSFISNAISMPDDGFPAFATILCGNLVYIMITELNALTTPKPHPKSLCG
jgi:hypothetical protein